MDSAQQLLVLRCLGQDPSQQIRSHLSWIQIGTVIADLLLLVRRLVIVVSFVLSPATATL